MTHTEHFDNWELMQLLDEKGMITPRQKRLVRVLQAAKKRQALAPAELPEGNRTCGGNV